MGKFSRILLAYDGSESSVNALHQAISLVRRGMGVELLIIVVMHIPEAASEMYAAYEARGFVSEIAGSLASDAMDIVHKEGIDARTIVRHGIPYVEIVKAAEDEDVSIIMLGRRGMTRLERVLLGGVTSRVIGHTSRNVLVVPRGSILSTETVMVATDGSPCGDNAVGLAVDFAVFYGATSIIMVAVLDIDEEFRALAPDAVDSMTGHLNEVLASASRVAREAGIEVSSRLLDDSTASGIATEAGKAGAGVVFMGTHGRPGIKKMLMGSVTERVLGLCKTPVFVAKPTTD